MKLTDDQKFEILKVAYEERRKELAFWRERSWKVTSWMVGVFLAFSAGATTIPGDKFPYLLIPLLVLSLVATVYLRKNYKVYRELWIRLADVEEALGFFESGVYVPEKSLNPPDLRVPTVTYKGTAFFIAAIWVTAIASVALVIAK